AEPRTRETLSLPTARDCPPNREKARPSSRLFRSLRCPARPARARKAEQLGDAYAPPWPAPAVAEPDAPPASAPAPLEPPEDAPAPPSPVPLEPPTDELLPVPPSLPTPPLSPAPAVP